MNVWACTLCISAVYLAKLVLGRHIDDSVSHCKFIKDIMLGRFVNLVIKLLVLIVMRF